MLNELNTAIWQELTGTTALTDLLASTTSVYHVIAPAEAALPYIVFRCIDDRRVEVFGSPYFEDTDYQFDIWSVSGSAAEAGDIFEQLVAVLDDATLTISSGTQVLVSRTFGTVMYEQETRRFRATARYRIMEQKG